jgi:hypothetical protein
MRHAELRETTQAGKFTLRVVGATELERLFRDNKISRDQFDAGVRLAELRYASNADGRGVSCSGCACPGSWRWRGLDCLSEQQEQCWRAYNAALRSLPIACRQEVIAVAVEDKPVLRLDALRDGLELLAKVR